MNPLRNISIRSKQTISVMLTAGLVLFLACSAFVVYEVSAFRQGLVRHVSALAEVTGTNSGSAFAAGDPAWAAEILGSLRADENIIDAVLYTREGGTFARYRRERESEARAEAAPADFRESGHEFGPNRLTLFRPVEHGGERIGTIAVTSDLRALHDRIRNDLAGAVVVFGVGFLLAFLLSRPLQGFVSGPILELVRTTREVTENKNYNVRATKRSEDELGVLVDAFNEMLEHIGIRDEELRMAREGLQHRVETRTIALDRATEEAAQERKRLKFIFDTVSTGVSLTRVAADGTVTRMVNRAFLTICGLDPEGSYEKEDFIALTHPDDWLRQEPLHKAMKAGEIGGYSLEKRYLRPDGRIVWAAFSLQRRTDPRGGYEDLATAVDITDLKEAQQEATYERDLLRTLLNNSNDFIYFKDLNSRIIKTSQAHARKFNLTSADELVGKTDFDLFSHERATAAFEDEQRIIQSGEPVIGKVESDTLPHRSGRSWVLTSKMPLRNASGEIIGTFGISRDITDMKEAEAEIEKVHRQLLEASRRAGMAEIATSVLHNVGNVLNTVNISATLAGERIRNIKVSSLAKVVALLRQHEKDLGNFLAKDATGRRVTDFLSRLSEHLSAQQGTALKELELLAEQVAHIKEIVATQQSYARVSGVRERIVLSEVVEDSLRMDEGSLDRHGIKVIREFEEVPVVEADRHKILQILVNLMRNARRACDDCGRPDKRITLRVANGDNGVQVSVTDNGVGIPPENLTRIFNHGFSTRADGHGFGLHGSALVAREMGGSLHVHSEGENRGATFTLVLPFEAP